MCFSAEASFTGAAVLATIGGITLNKVKNNKRLLLLALIPLIFALQQFFEGIVWLSSPQTEPLNTTTSIAKWGYLVIALLLWPVWIPLSVYVAESIPWRKTLLLLLLLIGIGYDLVLLSKLIIYWPPDINVIFFKNNIQYHIPIKHTSLYTGVYATVALLSTFLSSLKGMWLLGIAGIVGIAVALLFFSITFISVWCFFAAWLSIILYFVLQKNKH